jgi:hypothetical protein
MPVPELATEILPAFGPDGQYMKQLLDPIRGGMQALENAG